MAVSYMTKDGYDKILAEINYLETVKRPEISAQIAEARDKGDLRRGIRGTYPRTLSTMPPKRLKVSWRLSLRS